jgi:nickel-dependent lactate racemase
MSVFKVKIRVNAFFGDEEMELAFPAEWDVKNCLMEGHDRAPLTDEEMRKAMQNPYGSPRLKELAQGKKKVCILFDDIPKPTQTSDIIPFVLEELEEGGIKDEQIRFICAPGTHRPLTYREFTAKLGQETVERFSVYNHTIWENLVDVGTTSRGTRVQVNREFASCDLRIAIGSIFPHGSAGFGGGGKIILPGVCGLDTIEYHHKNIREGAGLGRLEGNTFRLDLEEAARLAGLHFKVDAVINNKRQVIGLFAGDVVEEHRAGAELARKMYSTEMAENADIVVSNAYPDEAQIGRAWRCVTSSLKEGGYVVIITHSPDGQCLHQFSGRFGTDYGGRAYKPNPGNPGADRAGRIIMMTPSLSKNDRDRCGPPEKVVWCRSWDAVLTEISGSHGPGTKVAVYPYAALQIPANLP